MWWVRVFFIVVVSYMGFGFWVLVSVGILLFGFEFLLCVIVFVLCVIVSLIWWMMRVLVMVLFERS